MLKRRIIPIKLLDSGRPIKTVGFSSGYDVRGPVKSSQVHSDQGADELVLLDVVRETRDMESLVELIMQM